MGVAESGELGQGVVGGSLQQWRGGAAAVILGRPWQQVTTVQWQSCCGLRAGEGTVNGKGVQDWAGLAGRLSWAAPPAGLPHRRRRSARPSWVRWRRPAWRRATWRRSSPTPSSWWGRMPLPCKPRRSGFQQAGANVCKCVLPPNLRCDLAQDAYRTLDARRAALILPLIPPPHPPHPPTHTTTTTTCPRPRRLPC